MGPVKKTNSQSNGKFVFNGAATIINNEAGSKQSRQHNKRQGAGGRKYPTANIPQHYIQSLNKISNNGFHLQKLAEALHNAGSDQTKVD
jgi:hypothetical protein